MDQGLQIIDMSVCVVFLGIFFFVFSSKRAILEQELDSEFQETNDNKMFHFFKRDRGWNKGLTLEISSRISVFLVEIFHKFSKTSGISRQNIFDKLYCNAKTNFCHVV